MKSAREIADEAIAALRDMNQGDLLALSGRCDDAIARMPRDPDLARLRGRINGELKRRANTTSTT